jgi:hypothetical protein
MPGTPRMAQAGTGHHRQSHCAYRAAGKGMHRIPFRETNSEDRASRS